MSDPRTGRLAVGGGGGFIGRRVCAAVAADDRPTESPRWPVPFGREGPPEVGCDALVWAAGGRSDDVAAMTEVHVAAPLRALLTLRPQRLIYLSSAEVYGRIPAPFCEADAACPESVYGTAKQAGEVTLGVACEALRCALIVLRPTVVYGSGQSPTMLLPAALAALRAGRRFPATAGEQTRDFLHVDDLAGLVVRCLDDDAPPGTYNAGSGRDRPVREALMLLAAAIGPDAARLLEFGALPTRPGEAMRYAVDTTRCEAVRGWQAAISLEAGLAALARTP